MPAISCHIPSGILNKITQQTFGALSAEMWQLLVTHKLMETTETLDRVVETIFEVPPDPPIRCMVHVCTMCALWAHSCMLIYACQYMLKVEWSNLRHI